MIGFRLFLLLDTLLMALPASWRKGFFLLLSELAYRIDRKRKKIIRRNLEFALNDSLSEDEKESIIRYCYRNLALNFLQVMENRRNTEDDLAQKVRFTNRERVETLLRAGKGIVFVSAHYGNWEIGAAALADLITPLNAIYKALDNPYFEPYLLEARTRHKMAMVEKTGALKHLAKALKNRRAVSLLIDQSSNDKNGVLVDFFSHPTYHSSTPALLSYKYDAPIVSLYIHTDDESEFTITFGEPITVVSDDPAAIAEATQKMAKELESLIRREPKFWFWCHKRWKSEYPEIYAG